MQICIRQTHNTFYFFFTQNILYPFSQLYKYNTKKKKKKGIYILDRLEPVHQLYLKLYIKHPHIIVLYLQAVQFHHHFVDHVRFLVMFRHVFQIFELLKIFDYLVSMIEPYNFQNMNHQFLEF